jgi:hypothetical protein
MKKRIGFSFIFILFVFSLIKCEKDDICVPEVKKTPLLHIKFFDSQNRQNPKNVNDLRIIGPEFLGLQLPAPLFFDAVSEIKIPLKVNQDQTEYFFYLNADNADLTLQNTDLIEINYSRKDVYISRACGFKTNFDLNFTNPFLVSNPPIIDDFPNGTNNWIESVEIVNTEINQDEEPHIYIYF